MKKIIVIVLLGVLSSSVFAWTIGPMNYQGRLLDNAGIPVTGAYNFTVRIYDASTGGTLKFSEQHNSVAVDDGVYSFLVSNGTSPTGTWDIGLWNTPQLYLEVVVNGETLTPRHLLASTPFAFQANLALTTNNALALGGKSAGNILQDICTAGKGKWLELASQCLGIAASFPGPTVVALSTLTASTDLTGLDLTKADISGIDFGSADFTGTLFKSTTLKPAGIKAANMTNTVLDGVLTSGSATFTANLTNATIKNVSLSGWGLSGITALNMKGLSAAYLTACPAALPTGWSCLDQASPSNGKYFLVGPYANLSSTSALAIDNAGAKQLDVYNSALFGVSLNFTGVDFRGITFFHQDVQTQNMAYANFEHAKFVGNIVRVWSPGFPQGINFKNTEWYDAWLDFPDVESDNLMFDNAHFHNSRINLPRVNSGGSYIFNGFSNALLENTQLTGGAGTQLSFRDVNFNNVYLNVATALLDIQGAQFLGKFAMASAIPNTWIEDNDFIQVEMEGNFSQWQFNGNRFKYVEFDGNFTNTSWCSDEIDTAQFGYNFNGATMASCGNTVTGLLRWSGICPNGAAPVNEVCTVSW